MRIAVRLGISLIEVLVVIVLVAILLALTVPAIQSAREASRQTTCKSNLRQLGTAIQSYHDAHGLLPPSVIWSPNGEPLGQGQFPIGVIDRVAAFGRLGDDTVHANWAVLLLPFLEESALANLRNVRAPISDPSNAALRTAELSVVKCPTDAYNEVPYERGSGMGLEGNLYARGNYAISFGPDGNCIAGSVTPDGPCVLGFIATGSDLKKDNSQVWGSGVAGVNKSFRLRDISDGLSKTIALEEVRAGLDSVDPRGVWALGQAGASVTVRNGKLSDAGSPNPRAPGSDELIDCAALMRTFGRSGLTANAMPCAASAANVQAGSRSMHSGGVNVLFADGSTHFIIDQIDEDVWHSCHTRAANETASFTGD